MADLAGLEARIGYRFRRPELLRRALTHSSLANETRGTDAPLTDNEQFEFLGDSVLGFLVAEALVERYPESREGELSRLKAHLVSAAHLYGVARRLDLGSHLELGRSEEMSGGRTKKTLLTDAVEALLAAIHLDGAIEAARDFVNSHVLDAPFGGDAETDTDIQPAITNFKSALQQLAQSMRLPPPRYATVRESGPEHSKTFTVEVTIGREFTSQAEGRTKKIAAQRAARNVYSRIRESSPPETQAAAPPLEPRASSSAAPEANPGTVVTN
jgi:ribonuclease-3